MTGNKTSNWSLRLLGTYTARTKKGAIYFVEGVEVTHEEYLDHRETEDTDDKASDSSDN